MDQEKQSVLVVNEFHPETLAKLDASYHTTHLWQFTDDEKPELIRSLDGKCNAAATASWVCDPIIYTLNSLKLISAFGVGVDGIDFQQTEKLNIQVTNTPDVLNDAVADLAIGLLLTTTRNLINADRFARTDAWSVGPFPFGMGLAGKTLGIIGMGRIGEAIVERALPFKLNIAYHNRKPKPLPYTYYPNIEELAKASDILLCMLPGGAATDNLVNQQVFDKLGAEGVFINVGRGNSVDEEALAQALSTGVIRAAGLDVYKNEPFIPNQLQNLDNIVLMPHIGSATVETRREMGNLVLKNLEAFFSNQPLISQVK
ncbi:MAG: 2-hydroxyacid dehydrogenase [Pseudomonadales bacterium]|nr:2-hydroxyacid dehydrogenase [Pseudomonadales bacterium]